MSATCKECGAVFKNKPFAGCPYCGHADIAIEADSVPELPAEAPDEDHINTILRHLLGDLCEKVYNGPASVEFRNTVIERTIEKMRPYLKKESVNV